VDFVIIYTYYVTLTELCLNSKRNAAQQKHNSEHKIELM